MINITCSDTGNSLKLRDLQQFQGNLKKRSEKDAVDLIASLKQYGLLTPFAIWASPNGNKMLDGHGRMQALVRIALEDVSVLEQEFPVISISADNEDAAKKLLLEIDTKHGKVTPTGLKTFTASIQGYVPPTVKKVAPVKVDTPVDDRVLVRLKLPRERLEEFTTLIKQVTWIEVW